MAATNYSIDLGFDWGAVQNSTDANGNPVHYLQWGVVNVDANPHTLATLHDLKSCDTIAFNIYDVSQLDGGTSSPGDVAVSISNGWITSRAADESTPGSSGISNLEELNEHGVAGPRSSRQSAFFNNETLPVWPIVSDNGTELIATVEYPDPGASTKPASYLLTWVITITSGQTSKVFRHDPEMIVNPGN